MNEQENPGRRWSDSGEFKRGEFVDYDKWDQRRRGVLASERRIMSGLPDRRKMAC